MKKKKNTHRTTVHRSPDRRWALHQGDIKDVLPTLPSATFDGAFFDPPYALRFMGHDWDGCVPTVSVLQGLLRLCKPGAHLLAFGHPKVSHRFACNLEDAGWELTDTLCWLYGQGFPKGFNIGKATELKCWEGYNTALKPAWEPIILAMKPKNGTYAGNALRRGTGGINIDGCRIGTQTEYPRLADGTEDRSGHAAERNGKGRWPANLILDEKAAADQCGQECARRRDRSRQVPYQQVSQ